MTALKTQRSSNDIEFTYHHQTRANDTSMLPQKDRATVTRMKASLLRPDNRIMDVEMDFDVGSGYHNNGLIVMNQYGADLLADALRYRYGEEEAQKMLAQWQDIEEGKDRKCTYLFARQSRIKEGTFVFGECPANPDDHNPRKPDLSE